MVSYDGKTIPRWRTAAILKIVISPYLSEKSSDFDAILFTAADFELDERHVIKNENFKNLRWRTAAILKIVISPYLSKNHPIFMKFCTQQQILHWMNVTCSKMKKLHWTDSEFDRTYFLFDLIFLVLSKFPFTVAILVFFIPDFVSSDSVFF